VFIATPRLEKIIVELEKVLHTKTHRHNKAEFILNFVCHLSYYNKKITNSKII